MNVDSKSDAILSGCGTYRYFLRRQLVADSERPRIVTFCMLNPSTADATVDDPTIRRCMAFAERLNGTSLHVINLYALRATDPRELRTHPDPVGPANDRALKALSVYNGGVICAWGRHARPERIREALALFGTAQLWCLGVNKDGSPKHPLYLPGNAPLVPWIPNT